MDGPRNYHAKWSQSDSEAPTSNPITYMWNLKKDTMSFYAEQTLTNRLWKTYGFQMRQAGDALGVWDGNAIKFGCDDHCTTINVINSLSNKKGFLKMLLHKKVQI